MIKAGHVYNVCSVVYCATLSCLAYVLVSTLNILYIYTLSCYLAALQRVLHRVPLYSWYGFVLHHCISKNTDAGVGYNRIARRYRLYCPVLDRRQTGYLNFSIYIYTNRAKLGHDCFVEQGPEASGHD